MKKISTKALSILLSVLLVFGALCVVPVSVGAAETGISSLSVTPADTEASSDIKGINWFYSSKDSSYYIFSPATYDKSALRLWFEATDTVTCGDASLTSGEVTDIFASGSATLTCGGNSYNVKVLDGGDVGSVQINTESGSLDLVHADKSYKDPGTILVTGGDGTVMYDGALDYIKGRGNSTWNENKKPYNIKLNKKADLFGMGKAKKWCLLANAGDATFMRNLLSYKFAKDIGVDVTSDVVPVNLYVNNNYMGAYVITEKVEIGENRVDIRNLESDTEKANDNASLDSFSLGGDQNSEAANTYQYVNIPNNPEDITGGYLLELEKIYRYPPEASGFITSRRQAVVVKEPEYSSKEEVEYIRDYYQQYEDAVYSPTGYNSLGKYYTEYVDVESIARMYLAEEFGANFDGCSSSFFLYKDVDGKICAGPAWDFDLSFQQTHGINYLINNTTTLDDVDSLYIQHCYINYDNLGNKSFLAQLFTHNDFQQVVQNVWNNIVKEMYPSYYAFIAPTAERISSTMIMNAIRWNTYGTTNAQSIINGYNSRLSVITSYIPQRYDFLSHAYSDDTYFVKYDVGTYDTKLVFDTTIYNSGDTAVLKELPDADTDCCCEGWYPNPDYSGDPLEPGTEIQVTANTNYYAKWNHHVWKQSELNASWQQCELCGRYMSNGQLLESWNSSYHFKNGVMTDGEWITDENGKQYKYVDSIIRAKWRTIDGKLYYFGSDGYAYTGTRYVMSSANDTPVWYDFGVDGAVATKSKLTTDGMYTYDGDLYYVVDGITQFGVQKIGDDYYFFNNGSGITRVGHASRDKVVSVTNSNSNGLLEPGSYYFGSDGKLVVAPTILNDNVFINGKQLPAYYGLVKAGNDYYYVDAGAKIIKNQKRAVNTTNGLTYPNGNAIKKGFVFEFASDGKMILYNGLVDDFFYIDGEKVGAYYGLVKYENDYYYVNANAKIVRNTRQYITTTNDLLLPDGTPVPHAYFDFDQDGKMQYSKELIGDFYYINGVKVGAYYGLVQYEGNYYYVDANARIIRNKSKYLTTTNGLKFADGTVIPHATYDFDADGKMVLAGGIIGDYYYINGVKVGAYYGLVQFEGHYYYVDANARIVRNKSKYLTTTNDLKFADGKAIPHAYYDFDADGRMILPTGISGDFYFINGVKVGAYYGLVQYEGDYYYVDANAKIVRSKSKYLTTTNDLKFADGTAIPHAYYDFDADGRMVLPTGVSGDFYYINGKKVAAYYGLVEFEGNYYYVDAGSKIVRNKNKYLTTTNDLKFADGTPIPHKYFRFDADGKMIIE